MSKLPYGEIPYKQEIPPKPLTTADNCSTARADSTHTLNWICHAAWELSHRHLSPVRAMQQIPSIYPRGQISSLVVSFPSFRRKSTCLSSNRIWIRSSAILWDKSPTSLLYGQGQASLPLQSVLYPHSVLVLMSTKRACLVYGKKSPGSSSLKATPLTTSLRSALGHTGCVALLARFKD